MYNHFLNLNKWVLYLVWKDEASKYERMFAIVVCWVRNASDNWQSAFTILQFEDVFFDVSIWWCQRLLWGRLISQGFYITWVTLNASCHYQMNGDEIVGHLTTAIAVGCFSMLLLRWIFGNYSSLMKHASCRVQHSFVSMYLNIKVNTFDILNTLKLIKLPDSIEWNLSGSMAWMTGVGGRIALSLSPSPSRIPSQIRPSINLTTVHLSTLRPNLFGPHRSYNSPTFPPKYSSYAPAIHPSILKAALTLN